MSIRAKDFMSAPVITATTESSVLEIKELMNEKGIHAMPVVSYANDTLKVEQTIRGIVTATDLSHAPQEDASIELVMNDAKVHVIHVDASAQAAANMMMKHGVHHLVVMDDGDIVGMISSLDFVRLVAEDAWE